MVVIPVCVNKRAEEARQGIAIATCNRPYVEYDYWEVEYEYRVTSGGRI